MSPEAQRLRETMRVHHLTPEAMAKKIVTELGITEEMNYALFRAWSDADVVGDQAELKKARHVIATLLEVAAPDSDRSRAQENPDVSG